MISPEALRRFTLFAGLDPAVLRDIAMLGEEMSLSDGEWLFNQNDEAGELYLLVSGKVELKVALDEKLERYTDLTTIVEGEMIGCSALIEPQIYTLGAVALSNSKLIKLNGQKLLKIMQGNPAVGFTIMARVAHTLRERLDNLRVRFVSVTA